MKGSSSASPKPGSASNSRHGTDISDIASREEEYRHLNAELEAKNFSILSPQTGLMYPRSFIYVHLYIDPIP
ncbi:hypothetical protein RRG08_063013 [Elysia crispata]|uniref:Uncharacterized protein n=1 Tax=Elysia crispata TaxID=231223 RepID=A0AAE0YA22_9GAST|nr:hypothetical protein RRG08_063013 [Elysia crispata]